VITKVLDTAPDAQWPLLIALVRYGGLRNPSETLKLEWSHIDRASMRMTITAPRTKRYGKGYRVAPIFPELLPYLEDAHDMAPPDTRYVIHRYRGGGDANLRTQFERIIRLACVRKLLYRNKLRYVISSPGNAAPSRRAIPLVGLVKAGQLCSHFPVHLYSLPRMPTMLAHAVYFSLEDNSDIAKQQLVAACHKFLSGHAGTVFYAAGSLEPDLARPVNDHDFDVSLYVVFADRAAHDAYQQDARHLQFIEENKANWKRVRVFDSKVVGSA